MALRLMMPPVNGPLNITANGRRYATSAGIGLVVPDFDAVVMEANGWQPVPGLSQEMLRAMGSTGSDVVQSGSGALLGGTGSTPASVSGDGLSNHIGLPGLQGFGVGTCPALPSGFAPLPGTRDPASPNYGNYTYTDGSVMCWIPAFWYRLASVDNRTYATWGVNSIDVLPLSAFATTADAAAAGYAKPRAFRNAGADQPGFFVDKYLCSDNTGTASSLRMGAPLSTNSAHNPIGSLMGAPANNYGGCFGAAKTRGPRFFPAMRYMHVALALLANAHAQAAASAAHCAWWDGSTTGRAGPAGCNNNALRDSNDGAVVWRSDGYSNCGRTGSGVPLAKTTHNGQDCGVADLNGLMWEVSPGITCQATNKAITGAVAGNPVRLAVPDHSATTGQWASIEGVGGMTQLNGRLWLLTAVDADTVELTGVDGSAYSAYTGGGTLTIGAWYALNEAADAAALTGGSTLATDAWGATGLAAHSSVIDAVWTAGQPYDLRYGNGSAKVLESATSGAAWLRANLGLQSAGAAGASGIAAYGQDRYYQYARHELCPIAGGNWSYGSPAGVWAVHWNYALSNSDVYVGFRSASYL